MREVATTTSSIVLIRAGQAEGQRRLTDEEAALCTRPISRKDYVQARIDGVIRFSHGGNDFRNRSQRCGRHGAATVRGL